MAFCLDTKEYARIIVCKVLSRSSESEPFGWWHARIKMMKGDFVVVDYIGYDTTYSEIVSLDRVRPLNLK